VCEAEYAQTRRTSTSARGASRRLRGRHLRKLAGPDRGAPRRSAFPLAQGQTLEPDWEVEMGTSSRSRAVRPCTPRSTSSRRRLRGHHHGGVHGAGHDPHRGPGGERHPRWWPPRHRDLHRPVPHPAARLRGVMVVPPPRPGRAGRAVACVTLDNPAARTPAPATCGWRWGRRSGHPPTPGAGVLLTGGRDFWRGPT
jgi:hypothetical protein